MLIVNRNIPEVIATMIAILLIKDSLPLNFYETSDVFYFLFLSERKRQRKDRHSLVQQNFVFPYAMTNTVKN